LTANKRIQHFWMDVTQSQIPVLHIGITRLYRRHDNHHITNQSFTNPSRCFLYTKSSQGVWQLESPFTPHVAQALLTKFPQESRRLDLLPYHQWQHRARLSLRCLAQCLVLTSSSTHSRGNQSALEPQT